MPEPDNSLIAEFNARRSEDAFAALVRQHVNLVFATAMRQVGDAGAAEEITQNVFVALAQAAGKLGSHPTIAGWLHQTALNKSREWLRSELRRRKREQVAVDLDLARAEGDSVWSPLVPLLDEALLELREPDRQAVILHFMEGRNFQEVGSALGVGEDTARKRVNRCLDELTDFFRRHGFVIPALSAGAPLFALSTHTAPTGLAASAASAGLAAHSTTPTLTLIKGASKIMAWTKMKTAVVSSVVVLLAAGTATVTVKKIQEHRTYPWQVRNFDSRVMDKVPPQVMIVPTIFPDSESWGSADGKFLGSGASIRDIVRTTYDKSVARTVVPAELPSGKYDYIANLPRGSAEALQKEIQRKFGVVGRREMRETDVLLLTVKSRNAPGLRPSTTRRNSSLNNEGNHFSCVNLPLTGLVDYLEYYLGIPVVDQTGLTNRFDIDLKLNEQDWQQHNPEALKQILLDQIGLELVPGTAPVEMLVVERAKY